MGLLDARIVTFLAVAEAGSFSKAADVLFLSAVSVKKQMDSLEAELATKLLARTNRGVSLTEAGRILLEGALRMNEISGSTSSEIKALGEAEKRTIRVGTSLLRPCSRLLEVWSRIGRHSEFGIEVVPFDDDTELDAVVSQLGSHIDCFLGPCDAPAWHRTCGVLKLGFYECEVAVPRSHPLAQRRSLTWSDLEGQSIMLVQKGASPVMDSLRSEIERDYSNINIEDTPRFYSIETFNECERKSMLMETLDAWEGVHPGFVSLPMEWSYRVPYGLIYSKDPAAVIRDFVNEIASVCLAS
ncbi:MULTISPECIES: LysR family transcriptional regulator [unclassified Adlercreutzia]|uniref:LysR family transcriptional regulator n=1 Tax=unclassified Adlercreutzia TaxID=2636013 RepID=UPI0013EB62BD|nr:MULTISPECIES: LysR family transcriptional regulator [unclassified Adlercreutzia]